MARPVGPQPVLSRAGAPDRGPVAGAVVVALLVVIALLKPWPTGLSDAPTAAATSSVTSPVPRASAEAPIALPTMALDPPVGDCYAESGWRICMLGETDGQEINAWFGPTPRLSPVTIAPTSPAVLLVTNRGAGLGLYAPRSSMERLAGGSVVSAWFVTEDTGVTSWIALREVASVGTYDLPAASVYRPPLEGLGSADRWPIGRYVVRLQAATGGFERWFAMEVTPSVPGSGPGPAPSSAAGSEDPPDVGDGRNLHTLHGPA